jgi:ribosomal subunit interface protein
MQLDIQARSFSLTTALQNYAEMRLRSSLTCFSENIQQVDMRLSDINGPRGGSDKRCQVRIILAGLPDVVVEDTQADLYLAINRSVERAGRTVRRRLNRSRNMHRQPDASTHLSTDTVSSQPGGNAQ